MGMQGDLFEAEHDVVVLDLPDADVAYFPGFFAGRDADRLLDELSEGVPWAQETLTLYGRKVLTPRLTAWHGDPGTAYTWSGITMEPHAWTPALAEVKGAVEPVCGVVFNSVLANLYRDGRDSVSWHADDEKELGREPVIASVSLGATRKFRMKHLRDREARAEIELHHGSLLVMRGPTQRHWHHEVPKTAKPVGPRVNLTFRRTG